MLHFEVWSLVELILHDRIVKFRRKHWETSSLHLNHISASWVSNIYGQIGLPSKNGHEKHGWEVKNIARHVKYETFDLTQVHLWYQASSAGLEAFPLAGYAWPLYPCKRPLCAGLNTVCHCLRFPFHEGPVIYSWSPKMNPSYWNYP